MKHIARTFTALGFFLLFFVGPVFAVSVTISNLPSVIDYNQELQVDIGLSCSGCNDSYLRAVFYPSGTNYFGFTQNNEGAWTNAPASNCTQYFKIAQGDLVEGSWSGKLKAKPDTSDSAYSGAGEYLFKVGRYTSSCGSATWSNEAAIQINAPSTPTPTPTPTPQSSGSSDPTPTSTPTPPPAPLQTATTPTKKPTPTPTPTPTPSESTESGEILGALEIAPTATPEASPSGILKPIIISLLLVGMGLGLLAFVLVWKKGGIKLPPLPWKKKPDTLL